MSLSAHIPWYKVPFFARGKFSPRLLLTWLTAGYTVRVIEHMMGVQPSVQNGVLVQPFDMLPVVLALLGLIGSLLALGTVQTTVLGDLAPAPGPANTDASPTPERNAEEAASPSES